MHRVLIEQAEKAKESLVENEKIINENLAKLNPKQQSYVREMLGRAKKGDVKNINIAQIATKITELGK